MKTPALTLMLTCAHLVFCQNNSPSETQKTPDASEDAYATLKEDFPVSDLKKGYAL